MTEISIILPAYNVENYVDICIESILASTFNNFELICIDDGSTDSTPKILDNYAKLDKRIIVRHQENQGLAQSRNIGKSMAKGKYISFIDSDDFISPVMLARQYRNITYYDSDMVISGIYNYNEANHQVSEMKPVDFQRLLEGVGDYFFNESQMPPAFLFKFLPMAYSKLYKADFIKNYEFPKGLMFEDSPFFTSCYLSANKISFDKKPLYYYRTNRPESLIKKGGEKFKDVFDIINLQEEIIKKFDKWEKYKNLFLLYKFEILILRTIQTSQEFREDMFNRLKAEIKSVNISQYDKNIITKSKIYEKIQHIKDLNYYRFAKEIKGVNP